ncbi:MAG: PA2779 family protein [Alcanivoracaceae bacterium]|nr:PA2779 family protein [Alcanivoracaceae bacterium]
MEVFRKYLGKISLFMALFMALGPGWSPVAQAAMVSTGDMVAAQQVQFDRQQLISALDHPEVQAKMAELGVTDEQVRERIKQLTPQELEQFEQQLAEAPAGQGVVGVLVLLFVVFIITDMLCATNVFSFVNCVQ